MVRETSLASLLPPLRLLLLGYGHVAQAFLPLLASHSEWLGSELGIRPLITGVGTRSRGYVVHTAGISPAALVEEPGTFYRLENGRRLTNATAFIRAGKAAGASLLIELTALNPHDGQPALSYIRSALENGLDVITANKGPIAHALFDLQTIARQHHAFLRFESTVMDGFPLINLAEFTLPGVGIQSFRALLNSTSNLICGMIEQGYTRDEAIREAQHIGIAEADPWYDLDGWDAAMKTTILANILLEGRLTPEMVEREGIRDLTPEEICTAAFSGAPIRLVSHAYRQHGVIVAKVGPQQLAPSDILRVASSGTNGVIALETEAMGAMTFIEHEPGVIQTAYGVLSDLVAILRQRQCP